MKSHVVHVCDRGRVCVDVTAAVWKPGLRESTLTNNFSFVFDASKAPRPLKNVLPVVRTEASMQLDAIDDVYGRPRHNTPLSSVCRACYSRSRVAAF